ncbi:MAG TPA: L,D-transpeptidase family protein [Gemmatimonadales bacterium]
MSRSSWIRRGLLPLCAAWLALSGCEGRPWNANASGTPRLEAIIRALQPMARSGRGIPGHRPSARDREGLARLYEAAGYVPLWFTTGGDLRGVGTEALELLTGAESDGLRPDDYAASRLDSLARAIADQQDPDPQSVARLDAGLSLAVLRYLRHLHQGRVNPRGVGLDMDPPSERHDVLTLLRGALEDGSLKGTVEQLAPPLVQYRRVRDALAQYRSRGGDTAEAVLQLRVPLKPGDSVSGLDALARRLALTGDLPNIGGGPPLKYEGALVDAVKRFQTRRGLASEGVIGKETLEELNVPLSWRVRQLELALERLRWISDLSGEPFLMVNIPMFEVTAWESPWAPGAPSFRTGVIVGKALDTETPVFQDEMRYIIFRPYWNIPPGITKEEVIPAIESDPDYLRKNNMEIVDGQGDDAKSLGEKGGNLDDVARGRLRIRQRPGPGNALGLIKFVFPNNQNIYLHATPAEQLFDRSRRDFSHGCVRVEDPVGLAAWVLRDQPEWTPERIAEAMNGEEISRRVNLTQPLPVILFYTTAVVEPDGTVRFAGDIYGQDRTLDRALRQTPGL